MAAAAPPGGGGTRKKFVLIDHTIADVAGHYYEYAVHVMRAAERAGYQPVLATNRKFQPSEADPWQVHPVYQYGFWSAMQTSSKAATGLHLAIKRAWFRMRCAFRFSAWGMAWGMRNRFGEFLIRQPVERASLKSMVVLTPVVLLLKLVRFLVLLALAPVAAVVGLLSPLRHVVRIPAVKWYARALFADLLGAARVMRYLLEHRNDMRRWWRQFRCLRRFAADTGRLFARVKLGPDDVVFIPTVSAVELMGLAVFFDRHPSIAAASWHLLFRRDIYRGRAGDYAGQEAGLDGLRQTFLNFGRRLARRHVFFHTDTAELTAQYNRLGAVPFSTLPIPHTHRPVETAAGGPLRLIYVGDARAEKGYQHLPAIVEDLWPDYVAAGRMCFAFQSNYNVPHGEPEAVIARSMLEALPGDAVTLFRRPLASGEYQKLLLSGDVNLLLYDRANYYARSSGILVEALSAGMPAVMPSACWLSRQLLAETYAHLESWRERVPVASTWMARDLEWRMAGGERQQPQEGPAGEEAEAQARPVPFASELSVSSTAVSCRVAAPEGATYALLTLWLASGAVDDVRLGVVELDGDGARLRRHVDRLLEAECGSRTAVVLVRLNRGGVPPAMIELQLASPFPQHHVLLRDARVDFFTCGERERPPLGAVGLAYYDVSEAPDLLRDLAEHYPHYRATARAFAAAWREYHNSARLIAEIELAAGRAGNRRAADTPGAAFAASRLSR